MQHYRVDWELYSILAIAIVVNLVATLPCLWGGFISSAQLFSWGLGWLLYWIAVTGIEFWVFRMILRGGPPDDFWSFFLFYTVNVSQGAVVVVVMRIYRFLGYRLVRVARGEPTSERVSMLEAAEREIAKPDSSAAPD